MTNPLTVALSQKYDVVLASSSPRRYEILTEQMGFSDIALMKPSFGEDLDKSLYHKKPIQYVQDTCEGKANSIVTELASSSHCSSRPKLIVCADTIMVDEEDQIYEKPVHKSVQLQNLIRFTESEAPIRVVTAVTIINWSSPESYTLDQFHEVTQVFFDNNIPRRFIEMYVESGEGLQVAGGFKVQGFSGCLVSGINGDYYNVVGLPLNATWKRLINHV